MKDDYKHISQIETYSSLVTQLLGGGVVFQTHALQLLQQSRSTLQQGCTLLKVRQHPGNIRQQY